MKFLDDQRQDAHFLLSLSELQLAKHVRDPNLVYCPLDLALYHVTLLFIINQLL